MGFEGLKSNALASVGLFIQIPSYLFSYVSDRYDKRGETVIAGLSMATLAYVFNRAFTEINNEGVRYFGVICEQTFGTLLHENITWMSLTCTDSEEPALAMAIVIVGTNLTGTYGAQISGKMTSLDTAEPSSLISSSLLSELFLKSSVRSTN